MTPANDHNKSLMWAGVAGDFAFIIGNMEEVFRRILTGAEDIDVH